MINVLLSTYDFDKYEIKKRLAPIFESNEATKVMIVPFSHHPSYYEDESLFNSLYHKDYGKDYEKISLKFADFGITDIDVVNPFEDDTLTMRRKIRRSDILFFTGGDPEFAMKMIKEKKILFSILEFNGIVMGASAGAMMQCREFLLYPTESNEEQIVEYDKFYCKYGLGYIQNYDVLVHFNNSLIQRLALSYNKIFRSNIKTLTLKDGECLIFKNGKLKKH